MKESWRYYDYLRRWGLYLLLGIALGALGAFGYILQQDQQPLFEAKATISVAGTNISINVVSDEYSDPKETVESIFNDIGRIQGYTDREIFIGGISLEGRYRPPLWQPIVLGSIFGGLLALGAAWVWDDTRAYLRHRQQVTSEDT